MYAGPAQIGWATEGFCPNSAEGHGVGDDKFSWSFDGGRLLKWHNGTSEKFGKSNWKRVCGWERGRARGAASFVVVLLSSTSSSSSSSYSSSSSSSSFCAFRVT